MGDWVVQPETYFDVDFQSVFSFTPGQGFVLPLTVNDIDWQTVFGGTTDYQRYREPKKAMTALGTRGHINIVMHPQEEQTWEQFYAQTWHLGIWMRIVKLHLSMLDQNDLSTQISTANYSLRSTPWANEEYVWQQFTTVSNIGDVTGAGVPLISRMPQQRTIPVYVKYRKYLESPENMYLAVQAGVMSALALGSYAEAFETPVAEFTLFPYLRTYVR